MELVELMERLCAENVLLWLDAGLEEGSDEAGRALFCLVGESGGVSGRFCGAGGSGGLCWNLD